MRSDDLIGWDLGGAHLKVAWVDRGGRLRLTATVATPLWQGLDQLDDALAGLAARLPIARAEHVLTMTGELVDLFDDRRAGVAALTARLAARLPPGRLRVYAGEQGFIEPEIAAAHAPAVASANWHATASWLARRLDAGLLVDLGSTTADLLAFAGGRVRHLGYSDRERLASGELVYTGVVRTPLMALCDHVELDGERVGIAAELFATTADIYRLSGELPPGADLAPTADGRGKGRRDSARRLARMVGMDLDDAPLASWIALAAQFAERQRERLERAAARQLARIGDGPLVGAGVGRFLVHRLAARLGRDYVDLDALLAAACGGRGADCAPAVAVALLAAEEEAAPCC